MLTREFETEFDILYNNILSDQAPGINSYEKSKFLSDAQDDVVVDIYKGVSLGTPFDSAEDGRRYISSLITQVGFDRGSAVGGDFMPEEDFSKIRFKLPDNVLFITYESATLGGNDMYCVSGKKTKEAIVVPCTQDEFWRTVRSPFRGPNASRVLKLDGSGVAGNERVSELVSKYPVLAYTVRYIRRPNPIILEDLEQAYGDGVSIHGMTAKSECELPDAIHKEILMRAVTMAKAVWLHTLNTNNNNDR